MSSSSVALSTSVFCERARLVFPEAEVDVLLLRGFLGVTGALLIAKPPAFPEEARAVWRMRTRRSVMARGVGLSFTSLAARLFLWSEGAVVR